MQVMLHPPIGKKNEEGLQQTQIFLPHIKKQWSIYIWDQNVWKTGTESLQQRARNHNFVLQPEEYMEISIIGDILNIIE